MRRLLTAALTPALAATLAVAAAPVAEAAPVVVDRAPTTSLAGASTHVDALRDLAYAGGRLYTLDDGSVRVFAPGASGNAAPQRTIALDLDPGERGVALAVGNDGTTFVLVATSDFSTSGVLRYEAGASGAAPATRASAADLGATAPIDIAERPNGIAVLDNQSNAITFLQFAKDSVPVEVGGIAAGSGTQTKIFGPSAIETAPDGRLVVTGADWVSVFPAASDGDVAPMQYLRGGATRIGVPLGAGLDAQGNLYVGSADAWAVGRNPRVLRFARGASGNVSPAAVLAGRRTGLTLPYLEALPAGGVVLGNFSVDSGYLRGPIVTYRALGPYAAPAAATRFRAAGKARAAKRTLSWRAATTDADVPVTGYAVKVTCQPEGRKAKVVLDKALPASARKVAVKLGKVRKGSCTATLRARNALGHGATARTRFAVKR